MNDPETPTDSLLVLKSALISQFQASLMMMEKGIRICSEDLWVSTNYKNRTWQLVYHTLFFTDLYLYQHLDDRQLWYGHKKDHHTLGAFEGKEPYKKDEMLEFLGYIANRLVKAIGDLDLTKADSGFYWYKVNKLEHQLVNLKHLQHHLAQLMERIRLHQDAAVSWIRDGSGDTRKEP